MVILPLTFLFVLLIVLLAKAPKVGAWVVGGLILLAPLFFLRFWTLGAFAHEEGIPLFVLPASFLFVLLVILLGKSPRVGAGLVVALVVVAATAFFIGMPLAHRRVAHEQPTEGLTVIADGRTKVVRTGDGGGLAIVQERGPSPRAPSGPTEPILPGPPAPVQTLSPIWSEGVDDAFEADVYPSRQAAVRALGPGLKDWIRQVAADANELLEITLFQEQNQRALMWELERALAKVFPEIHCSIEAGTRNIDWNEIGVTLQLVGTKVEPVPWANTRGPQLASGRVLANARTRDREVTASRSFIEKPWVEDFARFASEMPEAAFVVARSRETCTSENEARELAIQDASTQLRRLIGKKWTVPGGEELHIGPYHLQEGDFIVDSFVQSFDGAAGKIWRQAMLIDASAAKLRWLDRSMSRATASVRMSLARMIGSAVGVIALIAGIYFFLNMATRGYYEWSLRIAGVVLAIVAVVSVLMIVK
jgi:hypothetical protein